MPSAGLVQPDSGYSPSLRPLASPILRPLASKEGSHSSLEALDLGLRASLIRANFSLHFKGRYSIGSERLLGEGSFGRVYHCVDNLVQANRAVKILPKPKDKERWETLMHEVNALVELDHPLIVRLIEYFVEGEEVLLVMELLRGPTLGQTMSAMGRFTEELAARCLRHMLKALFCCHVHGIAHNDVNTENFKFETSEPKAALKMVDFGLSERWEDQDGDPAHPAEHPERDIWNVGAILFAMLSGCELFPESSTTPAEKRIMCRTDPSYVPSRLESLQEASPDARRILKSMLQVPSSHMNARDLLMHPFITCFYAGPGTERPLIQAGSMLWPLIEDESFPLQHCLEAFQRFHDAKRLKRLALLVVAHLLTNNCKTVNAMHWLFRALLRNEQSITEEAMRSLMVLSKIDAPDNFSQIFQSVDIESNGALTYQEFIAAAVIIEPDLFCYESMLEAVFGFFTTESDEGFCFSDTKVCSIFKSLPMCMESGLVFEACGSSVMDFSAFRAMMVPLGWTEKLASTSPAIWADAPDVVPDSCAKPIVNRVASSASQAFKVCQHPGFHTSALRPFYDSLPVSNIIFGIVRCASHYVSTSVKLGLAKLLQLGSESSSSGAFFIMPNPKYHVRPEEVRITPEAKPRLRFVAWWIHPSFLSELSENIARLLEASLDSPSMPIFAEHEDDAENDGRGGPGDFSFSTTQKPPGYIHTYRDLTGPSHLQLLQNLVPGVKQFLEGLLGAQLGAVRLSSGFHYPVRPQYSTLHLQLRVNAGDVCGGAENRGIDLFKLVQLLKDNPEVLHEDEDTMYYQATSNLHATLVAAAKAGTRKVQEVGPNSLVLT